MSSCNGHLIWKRREVLLSYETVSGSGEWLHTKRPIGTFQDYNVKLRKSIVFLRRIQCHCHLEGMAIHVLSADKHPICLGSDPPNDYLPETALATRMTSLTTASSDFLAGSLVRFPSASKAS